jgi:hypothetical protein
MLGDDDEVNRKAAVDIIKTIRRAAGGSQQQVREFRPPKINENAQTLQDLLPSMEELTLEPPSHKAPLRLRTPAACHSALHQSHTLPLSGSRTLCQDSE